MTSTWRPGAWAAESEKEEEAREKAKLYAPPAAKAQDAEMAFPSLAESAAGAAKGGKKAKQTFSLAEFTIGRPTARGYRKPEPAGLTTLDLMTLPKAPRDRTGEEEHDPNRLGGGFQDYGGFRGGDRRGYGNDERGEGGGQGERGSRYGDGGFEDGPSRADESANWGATKRTITPSLSMGPRDSGRGGYAGGGGDRYGDDRVSDRDLPSRADEVDNWGAGKKILSSQSFNLDRRSYGRPEDDSRGGPDVGGPSRADGDWGARRFTPGPMTRSYDSFEGDRWRPAAAAGSDAVPATLTERPRLMLAKRTLPPNAAIAPPMATTKPRDDGPEAENVVTAEKPRTVKPSPFGNAKPREEVLMEKGKDWRKIDEELEHKDLRKSWERPERPITPENPGANVGMSAAPAAAAPAPAAAAVAVKPKAKTNPFGEARPREILLQEKGRDWRKMEFELEHRGVDRLETEEEKVLREEITALEIAVKDERERGISSSSELKKPGENGFSAESEAPEQQAPNLREVLAIRERQLELLTRSLDDKVRFGQKLGADRMPRGGRFAADERPRSRGSVVDGERPRSSYSERDRSDRYGDGRDRGRVVDAEEGGPGVVRERPI